ncbi:phosphodiesterase [Rhodococcus sp. PAMC28707]|uniref:putative bifunctional diguanylate cyclase/phosphodiesterase n=1 Tax=unclassified Rhodococcus (in: high G+C Gram-positive bacteria) TaxID=192944 RepID=UPI00109DAD55|nr:MULTISPECIES: GGDEF domain-containing phosphodiesterase [unclassified Rhodococcus (in: high G+C Gram-positive bacteria)]QCB49098.1 phosphodiesterase [Rhodococcus sp. PAMC28705]QCB59214.1 phosphodiesterase [Rhodococcus sp. PAMC28707]
MKWWLYPIVASAACIGYFLAPAGTPSNVLYVGIGLSAVIAVLVGIVVNRPESRAAWCVIALGTTMWLTGDVAFFWIEHVDGQLPVPSYADAIYLLGYPLFAFGLFLLVRQGWRRGEFGHVANSVIVMIAFGLVLWVFVIPVDGVNVSTIPGMATIAYPAMDVLVLGLLVHFLGTFQWQSTSFRLLAASVAVTLATDTTMRVGSAEVPTMAPNVTVAGYVVCYVLLGTAALHPSMRYLTVPHVKRGPPGTLAASFSTPTAIVLTLAAITPGAVMAILLGRGTPVTEWGWVVVLCATVLVTLVFVRVTELLRLLRRQTDTLRAAAETDHLTGTRNRRGLEEWIDTSDGPLALLLLDIDRFKEVNDTFGHAVGDDVLRAVADRLACVVGPGGVLARLGADEFAVALALEATPSEAVAAAHGMHASLSCPISVGGATLLVEASIGIALSDRVVERTGEPTSAGDELCGARSDGLVHRSNLAMQSAKMAQPRIASYDPSMSRDSSRQLHLLSELTTAIDARELELYYQLQVNLDSMEATGVEALLRWNHPVEGIIQPDQFLPMAEHTGLIRPLANFVLSEALAHRKEWSEAGVELNVSVNISTRNLLDSTLVEQVRRSLAATGAAPENLTIEITETSSMADPPVAIASLSGLRRLGVTLAIDDYGTGYSALAYLQRLPVQQLKIDKTFVSDMARDQAHGIIVRSTIDLARTLGLTITAEGVEDAATLLELRRLSCTTAQGYFVGRPVPAHRVPDSVAESNAKLKEYTKTYER